MYLSAGQRTLLVAASLATASAVALAAIGSHAFADVLVGKAATRFDSALKIHSLHAPLLFALALAAPAANRGWWRAGCASICVGLAVFCAGLYLAALGASTLLLPVVPFGGSLLILGWLLITISFLRQRQKSPTRG